MNELVYVTVGLHFEVKDSYMYGGEETVGYAAMNLGGVNPSKITDEHIDKKRQDFIIRIQRKNRIFG